jgi:hypothetical protein
VTSRTVEIQFQKGKKKKRKGRKGIPKPNNFGGLLAQPKHASLSCNHHHCNFNKQCCCRPRVIVSGLDDSKRWTRFWACLRCLLVKLKPLSVLQQNEHNMLRSETKRLNPTEILKEIWKKCTIGGVCGWSWLLDWRFSLSLFHGRCATNPSSKMCAVVEWRKGLIGSDGERKRPLKVKDRFWW